MFDFSDSLFRIPKHTLGGDKEYKVYTLHRHEQVDIVVAKNVNGDVIGYGKALPAIKAIFRVLKAEFAAATGDGGYWIPSSHPHYDEWDDTIANLSGAIDHLQRDLRNGRVEKRLADRLHKYMSGASFRKTYAFVSKWA